MLALPAVALASIRYLSGPVGTGANNAGVEIHFYVKGGDAAHIKLFGMFNVPATCTQGSTAFSRDFRRIPVSPSGKFSIHQTGTTSYTVSGKFSSLNKASGTLRVTESIEGCDTGVLHWHAIHH